MFVHGTSRTFQRGGTTSAISITLMPSAHMSTCTRQVPPSVRLVRRLCHGTTMCLLHPLLSAASNSGRQQAAD